MQSNLTIKNQNVKRHWKLVELFVNYNISLDKKFESHYVLPTEEIIPTGEEIWAFHLSVAEQIIEEFGHRAIVP